MDEYVVVYDEYNGPDLPGRLLLLNVLGRLVINFGDLNLSELSPFYSDYSPDNRAVSRQQSKSVRVLWVDNLIQPGEHRVLILVSINEEQLALLDYAISADLEQMSKATAGTQTDQIQ